MSSTFASSRLVRLLAGWTPREAEASGMDLAERLSLWVNAFDAIGLQAANQAAPAPRQEAAAGAPAVRRVWVQPVDEDLQQVRTALTSAIERAIEASDPAEASFTVYRQRHLELQRQMEQAIGPLRERVRDALTRGSPALRKLAALDAVFEHVIAPREQTLLRTTAAVLQRRFDQLRQEDPAGWWVPFAGDWRQALAAELDLRLEPVAGLIEAGSNELKKRP